MPFHKRKWKTRSDWTRSEERNFPLFLKNEAQPTLQSRPLRVLWDMIRRMEDLKDPSLLPAIEEVRKYIAHFRRLSRLVSKIQTYSESQSQRVGPKKKKKKEEDLLEGWDS